jgi:hypothetical protein
VGESQGERIDARRKRTGNSGTAASSGETAGSARFSPARSCDFVDGDSRSSGSKGSGDNFCSSCETARDACVRASRPCINRCRAGCNRRCNGTRSASSAQSEAEESHSARLR